MRSQRRAAPRDTGMDSPDLSLAQFWYEDETLAALLAQVFFLHANALFKVLQ